MNETFISPAVIKWALILELHPMTVIIPSVLLGLTWSEVDVSQRDFLREKMGK